MLLVKENIYVYSTLPVVNGRPLGGTAFKLPNYSPSHRVSPGPHLQYLFEYFSTSITKFYADAGT